MPRQMSLIGFDRLRPVKPPLLDDEDLAAFESRPRRGARRDGPGPWDRPTVAEFIQRVEHQFGFDADATGLLLDGYRGSDRLAEEDIRLLCDRLGLPATEFGVDP
jgi:hypothetical protein